MRTLKLSLPGLHLSYVAVALLMTSCKPSEETTPPPPAPSATNTPPIATDIPPVTTNAPVLIGPTKALEHIGEEAIVRGLVSDVHVSPKGDVFLNFGGKYPNTIFSAVCFQGAIPKEELTELKGKIVSVSGKIKDYNGQVEIVLESVDQISQ